MWPTDASSMASSNSLSPRNRAIVRALAGDSTITSGLAIAGNVPARTAKVSMGSEGAAPGIGLEAAPGETPGKA